MSASVFDGLVREPREGHARRLRLDDAAEAPADEERVVDGTGRRLEFADRNTQASAEIHVRTGLDHPAAQGEPPVDRRPRHILRVKRGLVHGGNLRVWMPL